jgi:hypothetical protein
MVARVSVWNGNDGELDAWIAGVKDKVQPMVAGLAGHVAAYWLVDRVGGHAYTVTLWRDEDAAAASLQAAAGSRSRTQAASGLDLAITSNGEVVAHL